MHAKVFAPGADTTPFDATADLPLLEMPVRAITDGMTIRPYRESDEIAVVGLWRACGIIRPQNDPRKDIRRKLKVNPEWFLVGEEHGRIVATAMVGYEGHRGWINYLAVEPGAQRAGLGRAMMDEAERILRSVGCPKINLQVRSGNTAAIAFYQQLGFAVDDVVSLGKRLIVDEAHRETARARSAASR